MLATAFLDWLLTWNYDGFGGVNADYKACKDFLKVCGLRRENITLMYEMKNAWIGASKSGKKT